MFSLIYAWTNSWVNNREAGDLRHHRAHYDVIVIESVEHEHWVSIDIDLLCEGKSQVKMQHFFSAKSEHGDEIPEIKAYLDAVAGK